MKKKIDLEVAKKYLSLSIIKHTDISKYPQSTSGCRRTRTYRVSIQTTTEYWNNTDRFVHLRAKVNVRAHEIVNVRL